MKRHGSSLENPPLKKKKLSQRKSSRNREADGEELDLNPSPIPLELWWYSTKTLPLLLSNGSYYSVPVRRGSPMGQAARMALPKETLGSGIASLLDFPSACSLACVCKYFFKRLFTLTDTTGLQYRSRVWNVFPCPLARSHNRFMKECARYDYADLMDEFWSFRQKVEHPEDHQWDPRYDNIGMTVSGVAAEFGSLKVLGLFKNRYCAGSEHRRGRTGWEANIYAWAAQGKEPEKVLRWLVENDVPNPDGREWELDGIKFVSSKDWKALAIVRERMEDEKLKRKKMEETKEIMEIRNMIEREMLMTLSSSGLP